MKDSSNNTAITSYLEQLSVIRTDAKHSWNIVQPKERFKDFVLPSICSIAIHTLLFFIFSLSMFRAPIPIVSSDPSSIWLIPFINSGDIFNKSDFAQQFSSHETIETVINRNIQETKIPAFSTSDPEMAEDLDLSPSAEPADAELIVIKQPKASTVVKPIPQQPKPTPQQIKPAPVETRPAQTESPSKKLIAAEKEVSPVPPPIPSAPPVTTPLSVPVTTVEPKVIKEKQQTLNRQSAQFTASDNANAKPALKTAVASNTNPKPAIADPPRKNVAAKRETQHGIMASKTTGEMKLRVSTTMAPQIAISFLDFPATKWNKPLSRNEAKRQSSIVPLVISHEDGYDFIVTKTQPGIYTITAVADISLQQAKFQLILYEGSARETKKKLEALNVSNKLVIVKIIMPDGIIWDDESSFTGNLEDSESVTKFNTETGLVWKEYK